MRQVPREPFSSTINAFQNLRESTAGNPAALARQVPQRLDPVNRSGSYVRSVNVEARVFDPLARRCS